MFEEKKKEGKKEKKKNQNQNLYEWISIDKTLKSIRSDNLKNFLQLLLQLRSLEKSSDSLLPASIAKNIVEYNAILIATFIVSQETKEKEKE